MSITPQSETPWKDVLPCRHDWALEQVTALFELPFNDLLYRAHKVHRQNFDANSIQLSTLVNIKSGGCPEDCAYCPQSVRYDTGLENTPLMALSDLREAAASAKAAGATRFCMGAAWRSPREKDFRVVLDMVKTVKDLGLESCATLGMLNEEQAERLQQAGLDFYNHNLDTSEGYYRHIISTREYGDRLHTLTAVRHAGIRVCCGGIIGMGETLDDRAGLLLTLANLETHPESVPINLLVRVAGTPLEHAAPVDGFDIVRTVAVARIMMPASYLRLSAGRDDMPQALQALCFFAGANSVFFGEKLLTAKNPGRDGDLALFDRLGIRLQT